MSNGLLSMSFRHFFHFPIRHTSSLTRIQYYPISTLESRHQIIFNEDSNLLFSLSSLSKVTAAVDRGNDCIISSFHFLLSPATFNSGQWRTNVTTSIVAIDSNVSSSIHTFCSILSGAGSCTRKKSTDWSHSNPSANSTLTFAALVTAASRRLFFLPL